jgi:hypothetical protein
VAVCNNRGLCNKVTGIEHIICKLRNIFFVITTFLLCFLPSILGICECFPDWTSSDGDGHPGNLGDCAYMMDGSGKIRGALESV